MKIKNSDITAELSHGFWVLTVIVGNQLITRRFMGYTKREAIQNFKQEIANF